LLLEEEQCRVAASDIGPATHEVVDSLLGDSVIDRRRSVLRLLRLREQYGDERLERACVRAVRFEAPSYATVKRILQHNLDQEELPEPSVVAPARMFVRNASELLGHLFGGGTWN
jgi:hypothetical protein